MGRYKEKQIPDIIENRATELAGLGKQFIVWLRAKNYAKKTVTNSQSMLNFFFYWCEGAGIYNSQQLSSQLCSEYAEYLLTARSLGGNFFSAITRHQYLAVVVKFSKWLVNQDILLDNPAHKIVYPKTVKGLPKNIFVHSQIEEIISQANVQTLIGIRDRAMLEVFYSTGLRRSEVSNLSRNDLDLTSGTVRVLQGKGGKSRITPIGERACLWVKKYFNEVRPKFCGEKEVSYLFVGYKGNSLRASSIGRIVSNYVRKTGKCGSCHIFRHAMATQMLEHGASLRHIQEMLGHEQLATTQVYTHVAIGQLQKVYQQTHPANKADIPTTAVSPAPLVRNGGLKKIRAKNKNTLPNNEIGAALRQYLQSLQLANYSPSTIFNSKEQLKLFSLWCQERSIHSTAQFSLSLLEKYNAYLANKRVGQKPLASKYIHQNLLSVKYFFSYLASEKIIAHNFAAKFEMPRFNKSYISQILTPEEANSVLQQPDITTHLGIRDRAILETLYSTGIRRNELQQLRLEDVNFTNSTLTIAFGKGSYQRIVPLSPCALYWIEQYLFSVRPCFTQDSTQTKLFLGQFGLPLFVSGFGSKIREYFRSAGVCKNGSWHIFRHSMATAMLDNGADLRYVQQMLGHTKLSSTQVYAKVAIRKLKEVHKQTHPAKLKTIAKSPTDKITPTSA